MKIIQIVPRFELGGAEIMCENLTNALRQLGHEVIVVSLFRYFSPITERLEKSGADLRYLDKKPGADLTIIKKLANLFREEKPDVIHTHLYVTEYVAPAALLSGINSEVHTIHNVAYGDGTPVTRAINKFLIRCGRMTPVALSELVRETIVSEYGMKERDIPIVYNGINLDNCIVKSNYEFGETINILHIGRFVREKNHETIIMAFSKFCEKYPSSKLNLIGDGALRKEMEDLAKEQGISEKVIFWGEQKNVFGFLSNADIFVLPSIYEGMPMTLIEAMGSGLPIIASCVGGIPNMIDSEESGMLLENLSSDALAAMMIRIADDKNLRERIGKNAKSRAAEFTAISMAKSYCEVYKRN